MSTLSLPPGLPGLIMASAGSALQTAEFPNAQASLSAKLMGEPSPSAGDDIFLNVPPCIPYVDEQTRCDATTYFRKEYLQELMTSRTVQNPRALFRSDNPIHELIAVESEIAPAEDVEAAYQDLAAILSYVRKKTFLYPDLSPEDKLSEVYRAMEIRGISLEEPQKPLLVTGLKERQIACLSSSYIVLAVAHEMGWPVSLVRIPEHVFVQWEQGAVRFNMDLGEETDDELYRMFGQMSEKELRNGIYLENLTKDQLRAQYFESRGIAKATLHGLSDAAIADFDRALALDPKLVSAYHNRGTVKFVQKRYTEAIEDFDRELAWDSRCAASYAARGSAKLQLKRYAEAVEDLDRTVALLTEKQYVPMVMNEQDRKLIENGKAYGVRGFAKFGQKRYAEAIKDFDRALVFRSGGTAIHYARGVSKFFLKRHAEAVEDLDRAIALEPKHAKSYEYRGIANALLRQYDEAILDFDRLISLAPKYARAYFCRGRAKALQGRHREAVKDFNQTLALNPGHEAARKERAECMARLGIRLQGTLAPLMIDILGYRREVDFHHNQPL